MIRHRDFEEANVPKRGEVIVVDEEMFVELSECPNRHGLTSLPLYPGDYKKVDKVINFVIIEEYTHPELYREYPLWQAPVFAKLVNDDGSII